MCAPTPRPPIVASGISEVVGAHPILHLPVLEHGPRALRPQHSQSRESLHLQSPLSFPRVVLPDRTPPAVVGRVILGARVLPAAWAAPCCVWCVRLRSWFLCAGVWGLAQKRPFSSLASGLPWGPVAKTPCSHFWGPGSAPNGGLGSHRPRAAGEKKRGSCTGSVAPASPPRPLSLPADARSEAWPGVGSRRTGSQPPCPPCPVGRAGPAPSSHGLRESRGLVSGKLLSSACTLTAGPGAWGLGARQTGLRTHPRLQSQCPPAPCPRGLPSPSPSVAGPFGARG